MPTISDTMQAQQGLIRTSQLVDLAADRAELRRWTRRLRRLTSSVYADPHDDDPFLVHRAALLCLPGLVFRARTALLLHEVPHIDAPERLEVYVDQSSDASDRPELAVRRTDLAGLTRADLHGLPVVAPSRAAVDMARELISRQDGLAILDSVMRTGVHRDELRTELVAGSRNVRRARELVELADPRGGVPTRELGAADPPRRWCAGA